MTIFAPTTGATSLTEKQLARVATLGQRYIRARAPIATDDESSGYGTWDQWLHEGGEAYMCKDATVGQAAWDPTTLSLTDLAELFAQKADRVLPETPANLAGLGSTGNLLDSKITPAVGASGFSLSGGSEDPKTVYIDEDASLSGKVDKEEGKSLLEDTEASKIHPKDADTQLKAGDHVITAARLIAERSSASLTAQGNVFEVDVDDGDGTFTLSDGADTTGALNHDATAETVEAALEAFAAIGAGYVTVGRIGSVFVVEIANVCGDVELTADFLSLNATAPTLISTQEYVRAELDFDSAGVWEVIAASPHIEIFYANIPQTGALCIYAVDWGDSSIVLPAGTYFSDGLAPILTETGTDVLVMTTKDGGATSEVTVALKNLGEPV